MPGLLEIQDRSQLKGAVTGSLLRRTLTEPECSIEGYEFFLALRSSTKVLGKKVAADLARVRVPAAQFPNNVLILQRNGAPLKLIRARNFVLPRRTTEPLNTALRGSADGVIPIRFQITASAMEPYDARDKAKITAGAVAAVVMTAMLFVILFAVLITP
ncbi:hypothetical protein ACFFWD_07385 [Bradyrhizobium erythrophlei]|uniref:hypothetical protein n=1 Tax=Bradyrhizobium erythrophlei TaxID=1437360 RepID=UPI0035ECA232